MPRAVPTTDGQRKSRRVSAATAPRRAGPARPAAASTRTMPRLPPARRTAAPVRAGVVSSPQCRPRLPRVQTATAARAAATPTASAVVRRPRPSRRDSASPPPATTSRAPAH
ncbi:MAG: hypothetical protein D6702_04260 [Planctomycetota bacterium]|nr:MAG: hypothetical protein D6702_04260 [Planctomycetota bacterium]